MIAAAELSLYLPGLGRGSRMRNIAAIIRPSSRKMYRENINDIAKKIKLIFNAMNNIYAGGIAAIVKHIILLLYLSNL
jgi:hypothetical protein